MWPRLNYMFSEVLPSFWFSLSKTEGNFLLSLHDTMDFWDASGYLGGGLNLLTTDWYDLSEKIYRCYYSTWSINSWIVHVSRSTFLDKWLFVVNKLFNFCFCELRREDESRSSRFRVKIVSACSSAIFTYVSRWVLWRFSSSGWVVIDFCSELSYLEFNNRI